MLTEEDVKLLSSLIDEKLKPIENDIKMMKSDIKVMKSDINVMKDDIVTIKEDMNDAVDKINMISEWCEAATEYHIHEIHYPLEPSEKLK